MDPGAIILIIALVIVILFGIIIVWAYSTKSWFFSPYQGPKTLPPGTYQPGGVSCVPQGITPQHGQKQCPPPPTPPASS